MVKPKIYADFHNADSQGRLRLNCVGTTEDLARQQVELRKGLLLTLYADDLDDNGELDELLVDGIVSFSDVEHCWVAAIDWNAIHHTSDIREPNAKRSAPALSRRPWESRRTHLLPPKSRARTPKR